jgi:tetratricopeptide (TPR) repeat protein
VRQTLLTEISAPRRQQLHASVADAIERLHAGAAIERAGDIADHLRKAGSFGNDRRLVHYLTIAGKGALEAGAFEEARQSFRAALSDRNAVDPGERADLLANFALAERGLEHWGEACTRLQEALDTYITLGDREMIAKSCTKLTSVLVWAGRLQEATETARRGLGYLDADFSGDRARLLAVFGQVQAAAGRWEPANESLREALNIAAHLSEPKLVGRLLGARSIINYMFLRLREAASDGEESGRSEAPPWERAAQLQILFQTLLFLGRPEEAAKIRDELEPLATKIGQSYSIARCLIARAWVEFGKAADITKLKTALQQVLKSNLKVSFADWDAFTEVQLGLVDFFRGNWVSALLHAEASSHPQVQTFFHGFGLGMLFRQLAYAGDRGRALAILEQNRKWLPSVGQPNTMGSWCMLMLVIEGLVILGEQSPSGELYPLARELVDTGAVVLWPIFRFTHTVAGIAAAAAHEWEAAEDHFRTALQQAESFPHCLEQAEIRRFHAMMLMDRAAPGDRQRARRMLTDAQETYTRIGMRRHSEIAQALLD